MTSIELELALLAVLCFVSAIGIIIYGLGTANEFEYKVKKMGKWAKEKLKKREAQAEQRWIPIKWHYCTDEEREKYGFSNDIVAVFDNEMPDDNQEILITTSHGYVEKDVCYIDEGFSLDSCYDWIDDVRAWMPLPEAYREE